MGTDFRITEIDFRLVEHRLRCQHIGLRCCLVGRPLVDRGLRDVLLADKFLAALQLQSGIDFCGLCLGKVGALLLDRRLVGCLFDSG